MRIADVIGRVTLSKCHARLRGATWLIGVPLSRAGLTGAAPGRGEPLILLDELGAGHGARIAVTEGPEASAPFQPDNKPIDAYNAAILDTIDVD